MERDRPTVFVIGPPAAGKSTLARAVATKLDLAFRTIDDFTPRGQPMTDAQVQQALDRLFNATTPADEIIEFCHHDYDDLIESDAYPIFTRATKIFVTAPLAVCSERNKLRYSPVREAYVERAWRSGEAIAKRYSTASPSDFLMIDTDSQSVDTATMRAVCFLRERWRLQ